MADDNDFFSPPTSDYDNVGGSPIILGAPDEQQQQYQAWGDAPAEEPPAYLGDVNEAPAAAMDEPIVLGPSGEEEQQMTFTDSMDDANNMTVMSTSSEPSPMQKWNAEGQELLLQRKDEENARKAELVEAARVDLEQFQLEREQKREARMAKNREDEQAKLEAIEADLENDNSWQRVCKMVELSHDSSKQAQDIKRMRDILILLKNDTAKAVSLGA